MQWRFRGEGVETLRESPDSNTNSPFLLLNASDLTAADHPARPPTQHRPNGKSILTVLCPKPIVTNVNLAHVGEDFARPHTYSCDGK